MEEENGPRPNIRIEIQNNLAEDMEVEVGKGADEGEEGEISDANDPDDNKVLTYTSAAPGTTNISKKVWPNSTGGFSSGINIFDSAEQEKLQVRAKRFALPANEMNNFTEKELQELHDSLGVSAENERNVRFEAVQMRGIDEMSTEDVLEYYGKYGPAGIEWFDEGCCNVVWLDRITAARAVFFLSKKIRGMPVVEEREVTGIMPGGRSILLKNSDREVQMSTEDDLDKDKENGSEVNINDINVPIPPGYWRLGVPHHKAQFILVRFALRTDKKPIRVEKFSEQSRLKGITSESKKARMRGIFSRNREMDPGQNKNPWGNLARNWNEDARYAEYDYRDIAEQPVTNVSTTLQQRLGFKRAHKSDEEPEPEPVEEKKEKPKPKQTKSKMPRMKMYADEEEEKIKRKRQLKVLKAGLVKLENKNEDLRNILPSRNRVIQEPDEEMLQIRKYEPEIKEPIEVVVDLGSRLKNRKINNVQEENVRSRMRVRMDEPRRRSPPKHRRKMESEYEDEFEDQRTSSKVTVVIKKPKTPAVASTIWSRMHSERERLKTVSEGKLRVRSESSSSDDDSSSESSDSSSSDSESARSESPPPAPQPSLKRRTLLERPGFRSDLKSRLDFKATEHKSPLRIEISNDHFRKD